MSVWSKERHDAIKNILASGDALDVHEHMQDALTEIETLQDVVGLLLKYGRHTPNLCALQMAKDGGIDREDFCTCGFGDIRMRAQIAIVDQVGRES